jgi:serine/threonine-protein kinase
MSALARKLLTAFGLLGLAASVAATWVHYQLLVNPDYSSFCDINATVSCKQAYLSRFGSVAGVPVALGGVIFFALALLLVWAGRPRSRAFDSAPAYLFAWSTIGLAAVLYLGYASFFILKEVCPLCVTTYVAVIGLFVISGGANGLPMSRLPGRAMRDFGVLVSTPLALMVALLFLASAAGAVAFFPHPQSAAAITPAAAPVAALTQDQRSEFERWWDMQPRETLAYTNEGAKVLVVKFNDYQCPSCKQAAYAFEPILAGYKPSDVKYLVKNFPLNPACNPAVSTMVHTAACDAAAATVVAKRKGTFDQLAAWLFAHQEELSPATVREAAKEVGKIADFDAQYAGAIDEVKKDAAEGATLKIGWTPTFFINGKRLPRTGLPPQQFQAAIDLELKNAK